MRRIIIFFWSSVVIVTSLVTAFYSAAWRTIFNASFYREDLTQAVYHYVEEQTVNELLPKDVAGVLSRQQIMDNLRQYVPVETAQNLVDNIINELKNYPFVGRMVIDISPVRTGLEEFMKANLRDFVAALPRCETRPVVAEGEAKENLPDCLPPDTDEEDIRLMAEEYYLQHKTNEWPMSWQWTEGDLKTRGMHETVFVFGQLFRQGGNLLWIFSGILLILYGLLILICWQPKRILFQVALVSSVTGLVLFIIGGLLFNLVSFLVGNGWLDASNSASLNIIQLVIQAYSRPRWGWGALWLVGGILLWGGYILYRRRGT